MPEYLTPEEVSAELKVTRRTVYRWLHDGRLKAAKAGDLWRVKREDLEAFLKGEPAEGEKEVKGE